MNELCWNWKGTVRDNLKVIPMNAQHDELSESKSRGNAYVF